MESREVPDQAGGEGKNGDHPETIDEKPAVGVVLSNGNDDAVTRVALRAVKRGYPVVLTYRKDPNPDTLASLKELDVTITEPSAEDEGFELVSTLLNEAQKQGLPGLIFHENPSEYIDYERTSPELSESTSMVRSVTKSSPPTAQQLDVMVAIPAYNEAGTVGDVVAGALKHADEVVVVDDGSNDATPEVASGAGATVVQHRANSGYGSALRTAFREAKRRDASRLVVLDGDGQHNPDDIPRLVEAQRSGQRDIVIGNRFATDFDTEVPAYRKFGLKLVNFVTNLSISGLNRDDWIHDSQSGFRVYSERAIQSLAVDESISDGMGASTDILYHAASRDYAIGEVGTEINYDVEGQSSHHPLAHGLVLLANILRQVQSRRPVALFGAPGLFVTLSGLAIAFDVLASYSATGTFAILPAMIASTLVLVGIIACLISAILHSMNVVLRRSDLLRQRAIDG